MADERKPPDANACLRCGAAMTPGILKAHGDILRFKPEGAGFFAFGEKLDALACPSCGRVEIVLRR